MPEITKLKVASIAIIGEMKSATGEILMGELGVLIFIMELIKLEDQVDFLLSNF